MCWPTPTPPPSSATTMSTPRITAASFPATTRNRAAMTTPAGPMPVRRRRRKRTHRPTPVMGWRAPAPPNTGRPATRPCSTRARSFRSSSGTTPATHPRWWSVCARLHRHCSSRWPRCSRGTRGASGRAPSVTRWAGRNRATARRSSGRPASCSCCSATSDVRGAASWRCAATHPSRDRPTCQPSSTFCPATCRTRRLSRVTTRSSAICASRRSGAGTGRICRNSWFRCSKRGTATPRPARTNLAISGFPS